MLQSTPVVLAITMLNKYRDFLVELLNQLTILTTITLGYSSSSKNIVQ